MAVAPLTITPQQAFSELDFSPLARLGDQMRQQTQQSELASLGDRYGIGDQSALSRPYTGAIGDTSGGVNVQSWYDFARKPAEQGGLGLTHEQAAAKVANLQSESGRDIKPWGVSGDAGTAHGAAQWRNDRFDNLQKFAAARGLDYRSTAAQQAFMRHEYLGSPEQGFGGGSERSAYSAVTAAKTPEQAASAINRYYERSADRTGKREATARALATRLKPLNILPY
jgi:hypothetical protein